MNLLVDTRERAINLGALQELVPSDVFVASESLDIGDFQLRLRDSSGSQVIALLFERKTVPDLCSSIMDGRYKSQKERMLALFQGETKRAFYILEGFNYASINDLDSYNGISGKALKTIFIELQGVHGFSVICSANPKETCSVVADIVQRVISKPDKYLSSSDKRPPSVIADIIKPKKSDNLDNPLKLALLQLCSVPRMSPAIASEILQGTESKSIVDFIRFIEKDQETAFKKICNMKSGNSRKIGNVLTDRIFQLFGFGQNNMASQ